MAETFNWTVVVEGIPIACRYWGGPCNESTIRLEIPLAHPDRVTGKDAEEYRDGKSLGYRIWDDFPVNDNPSDPRNFTVIPGGRPHAATTPFQIHFYDDCIYADPANTPFTLSDPNLDLLCESQSEDGRVRIVLRQAVAKAIVDSLGPILDGEDSPKRIVLEALRRLPSGTKKEDFLPFVRACLSHLDASQSLAIRADEVGPSFAIAGQQFSYLADFERLAGRPWNPETDPVSLAEVELLPITPIARQTPRLDAECLECGATYPADKSHLIDDGGMGCVRCN